MSGGGTAAVEAVRGRVDDRLARELLSFWAQHGFEGPMAHERLPQVVCVLRDQDGEIAGVSSAVQADVELLGWRRFWIYRNLLPGAAAEHTPAMLKATFEALEAERDAPKDGDPVGLCMLLDDARRRSLPPEAEWQDPRLLYGGYRRDRLQVRIAYFSDQFHDTSSHDGWTLPPGYRVELFAEQDEVTAEDVIGFWTEVGALERDEAERRVDEALLIGIDPDGRPIGVATAFLQRNERLRASFWHYRTFVAPDNRAGRVGLELVVRGRDHLEQRFVSGEDREGIGMLAEIAFEPLKRLLPKGIWKTVDLTLLGDNARGDHIRVHYFAGAQAPGPDD